MRQLRITKVNRTRSRRHRVGLFDELPLDPRDPDVVRAHQVRREHSPAPDGDER
jgi:hypothetical protein